MDKHRKSNVTCCCSEVGDGTEIHAQTLVWTYQGYISRNTVAKDKSTHSLILYERRQKAHE